MNKVYPLSGAHFPEYYPFILSTNHFWGNQRQMDEKTVLGDLMYQEIVIYGAEKG